MIRIPLASHRPDAPLCVDLTDERLIEVSVPDTDTAVWLLPKEARALAAMLNHYATT